MVTSLCCDWYSRERARTRSERCLSAKEGHPVSDSQKVRLVACSNWGAKEQRWGGHKKELQQTTEYNKKEADSHI